MPRKKKRRKPGRGWLDFLEDVLDGANRAARIYEKSAKLKRSIDKASHSDLVQKEPASQIKDLPDGQKDGEKRAQWTKEGFLNPRVRY